MRRAAYRNVQQRLAALAHIDAQQIARLNPQLGGQNVRQDNPALRQFDRCHVGVQRAVQHGFGRQARQRALVAEAAIAQHHGNIAHRLHQFHPRQAGQLEQGLVANRMREAHRNIRTVHHAEGYINRAVKPCINGDHRHRKRHAKRNAKNRAEHPPRLARQAAQHHAAWLV